ncbi:hypothetical protein FG144_00635 [Vibrio cholerae]|nr:hypothetical protein [Vibrio cholerae]
MSDFFKCQSLLAPLQERRNHSPEFKAKVALDAAKGDKTISSLRRQSNSPPFKRTIISDGR